MCDFNFKVRHYAVDVFTETVFHEWWKFKTENFNNLEDAIVYAKKQIKKGNRARIYQISEIKGWQ